MSNRAARLVRGIDRAEEVVKSEESSDESSDNQPSNTSRSVNPFALLEDDADEEDEETQDNEEIKNGDSEDHLRQENHSRLTNIESQPSKPRRSKGKRKGKKTQKSVEVSQDDDINEILKSLSLNPSHEPMTQLHYVKFLQVEPRYLSYEYEFRLLFGKDMNHDSNNGHEADQALNAQQRAAYSRFLAKEWGGKDGRTIPATSRKLTLTRIKPSWPPVVKRDILMDQLDSDKDGIVNFKFVHSKDYQQAHFKYLESRLTNNFELTVSLLHEMPYHAHSLIQIAEQQGQAGYGSEASDTIEKALLPYERAFRSNFNLTTGKCRLPFKYYENRGFYLVLFKQIESVMKRGTWRTVLELSKVLLSLSPQDDPYGVGLLLDLFAFKAQEFEYFIDLAQDEYFEKAWKFRPNKIYSLALGLFLSKHDKEEVLKWLVQAIRRFPWVAIAIGMELGMTDDEMSLNDRLTQRFSCPSNEQAIYCDLYWERTQEFWQTDGMVDLMIEAFAQANLQNFNPDIKKFTRPVPLNIVRHVFLTASKEVFKYIPKNYFEAEVWSDDLFPPPDSISPYEENDEDENLEVE